MNKFGDVNLDCQGSHFIPSEVENLQIDRDKWKSEAQRLKAAFDSMSALNDDNGKLADKWKALAGELRTTLKNLRELFQPQSPTVEMINEVLAKAREAGL